MVKLLFWPIVFDILASLGPPLSLIAASALRVDWQGKRHQSSMPTWHVRFFSECGDGKIVQEKLTDCGSKAADVLANFCSWQTSMRIS